MLWSWEDGAAFKRLRKRAAESSWRLGVNEVFGLALDVPNCHPRHAKSGSRVDFLSQCCLHPDCSLFVEEVNSGPSLAFIERTRGGEAACRKPDPKLGD